MKTLNILNNSIINANHIVSIDKDENNLNIIITSVNAIQHTIKHDNLEYLNMTFKMLLDFMKPHSVIKYLFIGDETVNKIEINQFIFELVEKGYSYRNVGKELLKEKGVEMSKQTIMRRYKERQKQQVNF